MQSAPRRKCEECGWVVHCDTEPDDDGVLRCEVCGNQYYEDIAETGFPTSNTSGGTTMPHELSDGRIPDSMLHEHLESDHYNVADEIDDIEMLVDPDDHEDETEDARLFRGDE